MMLQFSLFFFLFYNFTLVLVFCEDHVTLEIANIGNEVGQTFDEEGFNPEHGSPINPVLASPLNPIGNQLSIRSPVSYLNQLTPERKHTPTLGQIKYLVQNRNNPAPKVFRRARVVLHGTSGVHGLINLKQIVSFMS